MRGGLCSEGRQRLGSPVVAWSPMTDDDGYPTDGELRLIREWPGTDFIRLMAYVRKLWEFAEWGWKDYDAGAVHAYDISTGGWSGNESLIEAMSDNNLFWALCWCEARRGGHYKFEVRKP